MWLPPDERRLLAAYFLTIGVAGKQEVFDAVGLIPVLDSSIAKKVKTYGETSGTPIDYENIEEEKKRIETYIKGTQRIETAHTHLQNRKLITFTPHEHVSHVYVVGLTMEGYDLGQDYAGNILRWSGRWYEVYRNHWVWVVLSFIVGIVSGVIIGRLTSGNTSHP